MHQHFNFKAIEGLASALTLNAVFMGCVSLMNHMPLSTAGNLMALAATTAVMGYFIGRGVGAGIGAALIGATSAAPIIGQMAAGNLVPFGVIGLAMTGVGLFYAADDMRRQGVKPVIYTLF